MHDAGCSRHKVSQVYPPSAKHFSLFAFSSSAIHIHRLFITSFFIHPGLPIRRLFDGKDLPGILLYPSPTAPQLPRLSHTSTLTPTTPTSTPTCAIHLLLSARFFHVWAEVRRFELSEYDLDGAELFSVAIWDGYFDLDLKGVDVADTAT